MAEPWPGNPLLSLLANPLIFDHASAYLTISGLLSLGATSRSFRALIYESPRAFRYLDLSTARGATINIPPIDRGGELWRNERMENGVTEEDFYSGPLRGILSYLRHKNVLNSVQTLILDHQTAPAEVLHEIICSGDYQVQILSLVGAKNLNEIKLRKSLNYAVRPSRPDDAPKLKGLYMFGASHFSYDPAMPAGITASMGAQLGQVSQGTDSSAGEGSPWYSKPGRVIAQTKRLDDWAPVLHMCEGIIAFDAVLCRGPKHYIDIALDAGAYGEPKTHKVYLEPGIASVALKGCQKCGSIPEGPMHTDKAPSDRLPLLSPPPRYTASIKVAQQPDKSCELMARCSACLIHRCCEGCFKFWCEACHDGEIRGGGNESVKVLLHLGLCVQSCLVEEQMAGAGAGGMWG
ncbi:MAG: hypothetical protein MMC23_000032 [Stictis urceolatum]|nr:hypothetical protein [Stictis urceolata]